LQSEEQEQEAPAVDGSFDTEELQVFHRAELYNGGDFEDDSQVDKSFTLASFALSSTKTKDEIEFEVEVGDIPPAVDDWRTSSCANTSTFPSMAPREVHSPEPVPKTRPAQTQPAQAQDSQAHLHALSQPQQQPLVHTVNDNLVASEGAFLAEMETTDYRDKLGLCAASRTRILAAGSEEGWLDSSTIMAFLRWAVSYRPAWRVADCLDLDVLGAGGEPGVGGGLGFEVPLHWQKAEKVLLPLNTGGRNKIRNNHWVLLAIEASPSKKVSLYDSMPDVSHISHAKSTAHGFITRFLLDEPLSALGQF
jgi:hypothetical protein